MVFLEEKPAFPELRNVRNRAGCGEVWGQRAKQGYAKEWVTEGVQEGELWRLLLGKILLADEWGMEGGRGNRGRGDCLEDRGRWRPW